MSIVKYKALEKFNIVEAYVMTWCNSVHYNISFHVKLFELCDVRHEGFNVGGEGT